MENKKMSKIYIASSWRNNKQQDIVKTLRNNGHYVYNFKNPKIGDNGFHFSDIDKNWKNWSCEEYRKNLSNTIAEKGFKNDFDAIKWADTFILVQPCGRSAHLELGWACGSGKRTCILLDNGEPELMVKMVDFIAVNINEVLTWLKYNKGKQ